MSQVVLIGSLKIALTIYVCKGTQNKWESEASICLFLIGIYTKRQIAVSRDIAPCRATLRRAARHCAVPRDIAPCRILIRSNPICLMVVARHGATRRDTKITVF
jgi:hypothetical protein